MARSIPILNVVQSTLNPGGFVIGATADNSSGNWTSVYRGKYYRLPTAPYTEAAFYDGPVAGFDLIEATSFDVKNNGSYAGRYTVYTRVSAGDTNASAVFGSSQTTIYVNEYVGAPALPGDATSGTIENVSTYYITGGGNAYVVPPGVTRNDLSLELVGRSYSGWGEVNNQNLIELFTNSASTTAPTTPFRGTQWFDLNTNTMKVWDGSTWAVVNATAFAPVSSYRHTQAAASTTWTVTHNLGAPAPFVINHSFFVDVGSGVHKPILPSDVTYVNANSFTVSFTSAYTGYALVRL